MGRRQSLYTNVFPDRLRRSDLQQWAYRLNMELDLQSIFGLLCTAVYSLAETPHSPPPFGLIYEGAIGQPR
jgi:hypothetical protein